MSGFGFQATDCTLDNFGAMWENLGQPAMYSVGLTTDVSNSPNFPGPAGYLRGYDLDPAQNPARMPAPDNGLTAIQHQLQFSINSNLLKQNANPDLTVNPAFNADGRNPGYEGYLLPTSWPILYQDWQQAVPYTGSLLVGSTVGIPMSTPRPASITTNAGKQLWWNAQHYGWVHANGVSATGISITSDQSASGWQSGQWLKDANTDLPAICAALRVLRNQHVGGTNPADNPINGPGPRVDVGPPPLALVPGFPIPSPNAATITPGTGSLTDTYGNVWSITSGGQVSVHARNTSGTVTDTTTSGVTHLAYLNGAIWYQSGSLWFSKTANWQAWTAGTSTNPFTAATANAYPGVSYAPNVVTGPAPTPTPTPTATPAPTAAPTPSPTPTATPGGVSANQTIIKAGTGGAITDTAGNRWTISNGAQVVTNGIADTGTSGVTELAYLNGIIYAENGANNWFLGTGIAGDWPQVTNPFVTTTGTSPNLTLFMVGWGASLIDAHNNVWTINSSGQMVKSGVADTATAGVVLAGYVNGNVYAQNGAGNWYVYGGTPGDWPTANNPLALNHGVSADHATVSGVGGSITDASGNIWSINPSGQVAVNGVADTTTSNVIELSYVSGIIWQENTSDVWYSKTKPSDSWSPPNGTATSPLISPNGTIVKPGDGTAIYDAAGNVWSVSVGGQVVVNGTTDATTSNVAELVYTGGEVWQETGAGIWYGKVSPTATWSPPNGTTTSPLVATTGQFSVRNGKVYDPNGNIHVAAGINVGHEQTGYVATNSQAAPLTTLIPGINHVRVNVNPSNEDAFYYSPPSDPGYPTPDSFLAFTQYLTGWTRNSDGSWTKTRNTGNIVCEYEDHSSNGGIIAGTQHPPLTGAALQFELDWYSSMAQYYAGNPWVWFGSMNEPGAGDSSPGNYGSFSTSAVEAVSTQQVAIYSAIRNAGSSAMIQMMCGIGGSNVSTVGAGGGFPASNYSTMTNITWELHCYYSNGDSLYNGNINTATDYVQGGTSASWGGGSGGWGITGAQTIQSADGIVPVIIGEWGANDGSVNSNPDGSFQSYNDHATQIAAAVQAAAANGTGSTAWQWSPNGGSDGLWVLVENGFGSASSMSLTTWGQEAAAVIAAIT